MEEQETPVETPVEETVEPIETPTEQETPAEAGPVSYHTDAGAPVREVFLTQ